MPYTTALHIAQPPEAGQWQIQFKSQKMKEEREQSYTVGVKSGQIFCLAR